MSEHTPGPWTIEDPMGPDILTVIACGDRPVYEWQHVAMISVKREENDDIPAKEAKANARLIAAAPELLEALKDYVVFFGTKAPPRLEAEARAAIAKAEGRP